MQTCLYYEWSWNPQECLIRGAVINWRSAVSSWVFAVLPLGAVPFSVSSTPLCTVCAGCDAGLCVDGYKVWSPKPSNAELSQVSQLIHHDLGIWNAPLINANFLPFEAM
ncbi:hypothetical protein MTR_2g041520 [Medicago truncatula]|uniref:Uncharacterized protein n=1 Tax=Medicago truncatula TaxID=3880 RepID=A0A072V7G0_MEDTR|nr:hypothetical protein MTR_2g041520 [Medicago truncatula]